MTATPANPYAAKIADLEAERARLSLYPLTAAGRTAGLSREIAALTARAADYAKAQALAIEYAAAVKAFVGASDFEKMSGAARLADLDDQAAELVSLSDWDDLTEVACGLDFLAR